MPSYDGFTSFLITINCSIAKCCSVNIAVVTVFSSPRPDILWPSAANQQAGARQVRLGQKSRLLLDQVLLLLQIMLTMVCLTMFVFPWLNL